ncbi:MAG TPA: hypothetical protein VM146_11895 [Steroidobacteraceae bacterium]|nr:hypothetical protein [Steroidobacteraceae bacterium]
MIPVRSKWIGALLLPLTLTAWATEPSSTPEPTEATDVGSARAASRANAFDLRGANVRDIVRSAAATQSASDYRIEPPKTQPRTDAELAALLRQEKPAVERKPPSKPRLPDRPPPCDGFVSCGVETLLGLGDTDEESYGRVERNRLMNQGSFTDRSSINASVPLPMSPAEAQEAGAPHKPGAP